MDAGEDDEDDSDEYDKDDESLEAFEDEATSEQGQKKRPERRPYPAWFRTQLATAMEQLKTDRRSLSGQSHSYQSGTFWLPTKSTWSILQKQNIRPNDLFVPKFFFWDPESLLSVGIACPYCHKPLHRHAFLPRPRRIIDIDCSFWIIGCSYRCRDCKKVFRSWDRRILANIPQPLAAEFPAYLTWRSGLSLRALGVLRSCIQSGMGAHQVASMLRIQHLLQYDELRRQYLQTIVARLNVPGEIYTPFLPFEDTSDLGFHGFVPSGQWLRNVYDGFIETHKQSIHQHTAMLTGRICAIDHSHKLAKHIAKVDGVPIFTALLTVTNDRGEIRVCNFVATKSHSQFTDSLKRMNASLKLYGHQQPEVFYTDNIIDKGMLEECFPSLLEDLVPVEKHSDLPLFTVPADIIHVLSTVEQIDNTLRAIMDRLPSLDGVLVVGFDAEWNVDVSEDGRVRGKGPTAVVQIALKDEVYILQVGEQLASKKLPHQLVRFLRERRILKAGRMVNGDLRHLETVSGQGPFLDSQLSPSQVEYAARDAYASLLLFHKINGIPLPAPVSTETPPDTPLIILSDDQKKVIARGFLSSSKDINNFDGIHITSTRAIIRITEVLIPGAVLKAHKKALSDFGSVPFNAVSFLSHLHIGSHPAQALSSQSCPSVQSAPSRPSASQSAMSNGSDPTSADENDGNSDALGHLINTTLLEDGLSPTSATVGEAEYDENSAETGRMNLGPQNLEQESFANIIRSRVLKDPFHVFNMIYISRTHALRIPFAQALRDAIFIPHPEDKRRTSDWLCSKGLTWDFMLQFKARWLWLHVCRTIPPPEVLYPVVHEVFMKYGPLRDAKTGLPLFSSSTWKTVKNILDLIRNGYLSDPPGVSLYYCIGLDYRAGALRIWCCIRGTNMTEGGTHTHLRPRMPTRGTSIRHMSACLLDFVLHHNLHVGTFNSTGQKFYGHDNIWLSNQIQELESTISIHFPQHAPASLPWVNGNLYKATDEVLGVLTLPAPVLENTGMQPFVSSLDRKQKQAFLAQLQGTRKAVLPIHTVQERKLFSSLMATCKEFYLSSSELSSDAVRIWNRRVESMPNAFYKASFHSYSTYLLPLNQLDPAVRTVDSVHEWQLGKERKLTTISFTCV
ncbi:hypothetical protein F5880DRAFT_1491296 [Lentinula raphanica]|nr:hypothetical protein F5880DRAFT_1491296 [Lentinula raphanica]